MDVCIGALFRERRSFFFFYVPYDTEIRTQYCVCIVQGCVTYLRFYIIEVFLLDTDGPV